VFSFKSILVVILSVFSFHSIAGWSESGKITMVTSHNGMHVIKTTIEDATCDGIGGFWWPADDADAADMLAIALAALVAQKEVRLVHNTETPECMFNALNKATHLQINAN